MTRIVKPVLVVGWIAGCFVAPSRPARADSVCGIDDPALQPAAGCEAPPPLGRWDPNVTEETDAPKAPYGCREARRFFVDFAHWGPPPNEGFDSDLAEDLDAVINGGGNAFRFCDGTACYPTCPGSINVHVDQLFSQRGTGLRASGHLRHYRVWFDHGGNPGIPIEVPPEHHCWLVGELRAAAQSASALHGMPPTAIEGLRVGREACGVQSMGAVATFERWHLERIGAPTVLRPGVGPWPVEVHVLDSEVDSSLGVPVTGWIEPEFLPAPDNVSPSHGTAMASLIGQIAPVSTSMHNQVVLNGDNVGLVGDAARAIDAALVDAVANPDSSTVINLSLGWLPEYERRREIADCGEYEDGVGEAMRYILVVARDLDTIDHPILVVSAAGNRALTGETPSVFDVVYTSQYDPGTPAAWWNENRQPMFMPSEWNRLGPAVSLPVGAIDMVNGRSTTAILPPLTEPALVAPGEHVLAPMSGEASIVSGSSVSTALVSGAAARAMDALSTLGPEERLTGRQIGRLLYLTGVKVGRKTLDEIEVRRLDIERLDCALDCANLPGLVQCVTGNDSLSLAGMAVECEEHLSGGSGCGCPGPAPSSPSRPNFVLPFWANNSASCVESVAAQAVEVWPNLDIREDPAGKPLFWATDASGKVNRLDTTLLGATNGTQGLGGCVDCVARYKSAAPGPSVEFDLHFNPATAAGTRYYNPRVELVDELGHWMTVELAPPNRFYLPGQAVSFRDIAWPGGYGKPISAFLVTTSFKPYKNTARDAAPLCLTIETP